MKTDFNNPTLFEHNFPFIEKKKFSFFFYIFDAWKKHPTIS